MLKILHKGPQISLDVDPTLTDGDIEEAKTALAAFKGGRLVGVDPATGFVALADGALAGTVKALGFLINDAAGYFYENIPAVASGKVGVTFGANVVVTDQIKGGVTFAAGDRVYAGTGADVGLVVKTAPTGAGPIGIALSDASPAAPELTIAVSIQHQDSIGAS